MRQFPTLSLRTKTLQWISHDEHYPKHCSRIDNNASQHTSHKRSPIVLVNIPEKIFRAIKTELSIVQTAAKVSKTGPTAFKKSSSTEDFSRVQALVNLGTVKETNKNFFTGLILGRTRKKIFCYNSSSGGDSHSIYHIDI